MPLKNKEARRDYCRKYQEKNKEKIKANRKIWVEENRGKMQEYHKEYHKKWYEENREERSKQIKEYASTHKEDSVKRVQKYVKNNREKVRTYNKSYQNSDEGLFRTTKHNASKRGKKFYLSLEEFKEIVNQPCIYCGDREVRIGIDRVNNNYGYTKKNSAPCCPTCNYMKKTLTKKHFLSHINKIYNHNH